MKNDNLVQWGTDNELVKVNADEIPDIVAGTIKGISDLEKEVRSSDESAKKALDYVHNSMKEYETGWFGFRKGNTKDIIEDTQEGVKQLAEALNVTVSAMQKALEFQKKLAAASKYLFGLGCANITTNRIAVRAIEMKLQGASGARISELAKQEMMAVVRQLKEQEDILKKQEFLTSQVKENVSRLDKKDILDKEQSDKIKSLSEENTKQKKELTNILNTLLKKDQIDAEQSRRLEELQLLLTQKDEFDKKQEDAISDNKKTLEKNTEAIKVLFEYTKQKDVLDKEQTAEIEKIKKASERKLCIIAIGLASFSLICGAISIVLQIIR